MQDRIADVSFLITRSDLLAPKKEMVDKLLPYMQEVLRNALGRTGRNVRLGNVSMVSAKQGWWNKKVKEGVWWRGGAHWMVGKANVGKSNLFEVIFPKGQHKVVDFDSVRNAFRHKDSQDAMSASEAAGTSGREEFQLREDEEPEEEPILDENALLPPAQKETLFPVMPVISSVPGTTASPIRIPFGNGRGELIDLPGLVRSDVEKYVKAEHHVEMLMKRRMQPDRESIKPGQSLLLGGGLIRITPTTPDLVFLSHAFVPIDAHSTSTAKAVGMQTGERGSGVPCIMTDEARATISSAGKFKLEWDVTRKYFGSTATSHAGREIKTADLPLTIYSADVLIEGIGWIELAAQVRKPSRKAQEQTTAAGVFEDFPETMSALPFPEFEVFSPEGKFVAIRQPMCGWLLNRPKPRGVNAKGRPRKSMKSAKAQRKPNARA